MVGGNPGVTNSCVNCGEWTSRRGCRGLTYSEWICETMVSVLRPLRPETKRESVLRSVGSGSLKKVFLEMYGGES